MLKEAMKSTAGRKIDVRHGKLGGVVLETTSCASF